MLKKCAVILVLSLTLAGCFGDDTTPTPAETTTVATETRTGTVKPLGDVSAYSSGTHLLEKDGKIVCLLESGIDTIKLADYLNKVVTVIGTLKKTTEGNADILTVTTINTATAATPTDEAPLTYTDEQLHFSLSYPGTLTTQQTRTGVAFYDGTQKIIEASVIDNALSQPLATFLTKTYGYTYAQLSKISAAGLSGYAYKNSTGEVVYLAKDTKIYAIAWLDVDDTNLARNKRYYLQIIQSLKISAKPAADAVEGGTVGGLGEFCGGIAATPCASGLSCQLDGANPDAGGICVKAVSGAATSGATIRAEGVPDAAGLTTITDLEKARGWYYGDRSTKKPGTPATWVLVDSGTRFAMWRRPDALPDEEPALATPTASTSDLPADRTAVFTYLKNEINSLAVEAPESGKWSVAQVAFAEPAYVYVVYRANDISRRLLFVYAVADGEVSLTKKAYFRPGYDRDWILSEGADVAAGKALTIVNADGAVTSSVSAGLKEYAHKTAGFRLQYPSNWYWQNATAVRAEFSDAPFPRGLVRVAVEIVSGVDYFFDELRMENTKNVIYTRLNAKQSVRFSADPSYADRLQTMASTFQIDKK